MDDVRITSPVGTLARSCITRAATRCGGGSRSSTGPTTSTVTPPRAKRASRWVYSPRMTSLSCRCTRASGSGWTGLSAGKSLTTVPRATDRQPAEPHLPDPSTRLRGHPLHDVTRSRQPLLDGDRPTGRACCHIGPPQDGMSRACLPSETPPSGKRLARSRAHEGRELHSGVETRRRMSIADVMQRGRVNQVGAQAWDDRLDLLRPCDRPRLSGHGGPDQAHRAGHRTKPPPEPNGS